MCLAKTNFNVVFISYIDVIRTMSVCKLSVTEMIKSDVLINSPELTRRGSVLMPDTHLVINAGWVRWKAKHIKQR